MQRKEDQDITFEKALEELEKITTKLEEGKESLEESMRLYDRGIMLKKFCEKKLKEAEGRWSVLKKTKDGLVQEIDLNKDTFASDKDQVQGQFDLF